MAYDNDPALRAGIVSIFQDASSYTPDVKAGSFRSGRIESRRPNENDGMDWEAAMRRDAIIGARGRGR